MWRVGLVVSAMLIGCGGAKHPGASVARDAAPPDKTADTIQPQPAASVAPNLLPAAPMPASTTEAQSAVPFEATKLCDGLRAIAVVTTVIKDPSVKRITLSKSLRVEPFTSCRNRLDGTHAPKDHFGPAFNCELEGTNATEPTYVAIRDAVTKCFASELSAHPMPSPVEGELGFTIEEKSGKRVTRKSCSLLNNLRSTPALIDWDCYVTMDHITGEE